jgi:hypothetical protein
MRQYVRQSKIAYQTMHQVEILPSGEYSMCSGTRLVSVNVPLESGPPFVYWTRFVSARW